MTQKLRVKQIHRQILKLVVLEKTREKLQKSNL